MTNTTSVNSLPLTQYVPTLGTYGKVDKTTEAVKEDIPDPKKVNNHNPTMNAFDLTHVRLAYINIPFAFFNSQSHKQMDVMLRITS